MKHKTRFKSDEIAHVWANRGAPYGHNGSNMSFDGDAFKSYATVIARRMTHKGRDAYVIDRCTFSNSTAKHFGKVYRALPEGATIFRPTCGNRGQTLSFTPLSLAAHFETEAKEADSAEPSRYAHKRAEQYRNVSDLYRQARDVLAFFGLGTKRLDSILSKRAAGEVNASEVMKARGAKLRADRAKREVKEQAAYTARQIEQAEAALSGKVEVTFPYAAPLKALAVLPVDLRVRLVAFIEAGNAAHVAKWIAGEAVILPHDHPTLLRVEGDGEAAEMVTSRGARVPLSDAARTYRFAKALRARGWHRNGETHAIGMYQLDAVNEQGVIAGCHRVSWDEIDRFAKAQGWIA